MLSSHHLLLQLPHPVAILMGPEFVVALANGPLLRLVDKKDGEILRRSFFDMFPHLRPALLPMFYEVLEKGRVFTHDEVPVAYHFNGQPKEGYYKVMLTQLKNEGGEPVGIMASGYDITTEVRNRKKAEHQQTHLTNLLSQVAAGIGRCDLDGNYLEVNDRFCAMLGYSKEELCQMNLAAVVHPEDWHRMEPQFRKCIGEGTDLLLEKRLLRKDGTLVWVNNCLSRIEEQGRPAFLTEVCIDITAQRAALAQLDEKIREVSDYKYALDKSSIIAITDQKGTIQYVNDNFCRISGFNAAELIGQDHRIVNSGYHTKEFFQDLWRTIAQGNIWKGEIRNKAKDGRIYWVDTTIVPFLDKKGKPYRYIAIRSDITARKQVEEKIRESEERYATVVEASDLGLWDFDVRKGKLVAAGRMDVLYGLESNDAYTLERALASVHPDDRVEQDRILQQIIAGKISTSFVTEFRIIDNTTGQVKWLRARAKAFFDEQGTLYRTVGTAADITQQKEAQELLEESEDRLNLVVDAAGIGMWDYNINTNEAVLSARSRSFYGLAPGEPFTFERFLAAVHPEDRDFVAKGNQQVLFGDTPTDTYLAEFRVVHPDGSIRWNRSHGRVLRDAKGQRYRFIGAIVDITEEKEAARVLMEREREYRSLAENSPDYIGRHDRDLRFLYVSPQLARLTGNEPGELLGLTLFDVGLPHSLAAFLTQHMEEVIQERKPRSVEYLSANGKAWLYSRMVPELGSSGEVEAILVITTDITNLKKAEEALRDSENRFRTMANSIPQLAWMTNETGQIYWYNQRWFDFTGTTPEAMERWGWSKVIHPAMLEGVTERIGQAFRNGQEWEDTFLLRGKDGQYRWFLSRAVPVRNEDGTLRGWFGTNTDITEQRNTEEALKLTRDQLELTFQHVPSAIYLVDRSGQMLYLNQKAAQEMGFESVAEVMAHPNMPELRRKMEHLYETRSETGEPISLDDDSMGITFRSRQPSEVLIQLIHRASGEKTWILSHSAPLFDPEGALLMVLTTTTDVTDQKMFTEKLEQEVARRTRELQRSNDDLQQFAHAASHDLKEPVRKVLTFLDRFLKEYGPTLPEKANFYLQRSELAARRSYAMIDGLLKYSKVDAAVNLHQQIDLVELLHQVQHDLELLIQQKNARFAYGQLPVVKGAPELVYQLFYNLVINALKFSRDGEAPFIKVWANPQTPGNPMVTIVVEDNGIGFDPRYAEQIFQTYTRLHSKDQFEGSGLGLALCRKIVERHGGTIHAEGQQDKGARFVVQLPGSWQQA